MRRLMVFCVIVTLCLAPPAYGDKALDDALITAVINAGVFKMQGSLTIVQDLLAKGANVNAKDDNYGNTPLMWASLYGSMPLVQTLLSKGAQVNAKDKDGATALIKAAGTGNLAVVNALLDNGADVNAKTTGGSSALSLAVHSGYQQIVQALKAKGAVGEAQTAQARPKVAQETTKGGGGPAGDSSLDNALLDASKRGDLPKVQALLTQGANVNFKSKEDGCTPLMLAATNGYLLVVQALLAKGADVNDKDHTGGTALMDAADMGHLPVIQALLARGADVNARDQEGATALEFAEFSLNSSDKNEIINVLRRAGAR